jgi:hypothetical protein
MSAERNHTHLTEQVTTLGSAERSLRSASPPVRFVQPPYKLNAIGKPYSANYSPNYRMNHRPSYGHLRAPYPTTMRFVGDPPNYDPNLRCFRGDQWWTQLQTQRRKQQPKSEENAAATLSWKENARKAEFTKRAPSGGRYILSPFLHCWNVDYCEKKSKKRQQLGFACTLDEAKAIAEADNKNGTRS